MAWARLSSAWRAPVAAAGIAGAVLGMLPGAFLISLLRDPLPTLAVGPVLFVNSAIFAGLASLWAANLVPPVRGDRSLFGPIMTVALSVGAMVAALWVVLLWSGTWSRAFPFSPYQGLLGLSLFVGVATSVAACMLREPYEPDVYDLVFTVLWTFVPAVLILGLVQTACAHALCA